MHENCGDRPLLGSVLVTHGVVESGELDEALLDQAESGKHLGEILVDRGLIGRPELDRAIAGQSEVAGDAIFESSAEPSLLRLPSNRRSHRIFLSHTYSPCPSNATAHSEM
jgi:hypothetical protein